MKDLFNILWCTEFGAKEHLLGFAAALAIIAVCVVSELILG